MQFMTNPIHPEVLAIAKLLDHAVLHPTNGEAHTIAGCELGKKFSVAAVCVKPCFVPVAARVLAGSPTAVCAVTGFPHGNSSTKVKVFETIAAIEEGATEIDTVVNNGLVTDGNWSAVAAEIEALQEACATRGAILKVIFENDYLTIEKITKLTMICGEAGVAYVKTSTGFGYVKQANGDFNYKGATVEAVQAMLAACPPGTGVKAAAAIRTLDDVIKFRDLGCTRIGVGATESILNEALARFAGEKARNPSGAEGY